MKKEDSLAKRQNLSQIPYDNKLSSRKGNFPICVVGARAHGFEEEEPTFGLFLFIS